MKTFLVPKMEHQTSYKMSLSPFELVDTQMCYDQIHSTRPKFSSEWTIWMELDAFIANFFLSIWKLFLKRIITKIEIRDLNFELGI